MLSGLLKCVVLFDWNINCLGHVTMASKLQVFLNPFILNIRSFGIVFRLSEFIGLAL